LLRQADGLVHISRGFEDEEIVHPQGNIDPVRDIRDMEEELKSVDFISIEKRMEKLELDRKKQKSKEIEEEYELMEKLKTFLEAGKSLREFEFNPHEEQSIRGFTFLSQKPLINIINTDENNFARFAGEFREPANNTATIIFCGKIEKELLELEKEERRIFQEEYGLNDYQYIKENLLLTSYKLMDLISFFTVGKEETKAWTIKKESSAFTAAGKIHSDIQEGFIKAEVVNWQDFLNSGGFSGAKEKGLLKLEGKDYLIQDGEVIYFRFNK
jgi:GTP-binding protein YchF